jgi:C-terminal domain 7 of the ABC-three component (ABC-3C) systems
MPVNLNPTSAAGQLLGYSLQVSEFARQLLVAPAGTVVSLEVFEDVGTTSPSGESVAIQTKSVLDGNPIANRARDFWKTLAIWAAAVSTKRLDPKYTLFRIHVFSKKSGTIAESFANALTADAAKAALSAAKAELRLGKEDLPDSIREFVESFFGTDEPLLREIVKNFELSFGSGDSEADLKAALLSKWAPENALEEVLDKALGFVKRRLDSAIQQKQVPSIQVDDFNRELAAYVGKLRIHNFLNDFAGELDPGDVETHRLKIYVRQLEIVGADDDDVLRAINAFLRSAHNRAVWANKGMVWSESFEEFEKALISYWRNTKKQQDLDYGSEANEKRGLRLLVDCLKHRPLLEGKVAPDDFTPGSFHTLADFLEIGWHPEFKKRLTKD